VNTLGFAHPYFGPSQGARHVELDLNEAGGDGAPAAGTADQDVITMAEVIEHLYTAPDLVLGYLATWLAPAGALVLQTPNAVALHKRVRMLAGRNPLEAIRHERGNPGHFHEYTAGELHGAAQAAGLRVEALEADNYFGSSAGHRAYGALARALPLTLRHGLTAILRRPGPGG
jgi:methyltransferase family protein